MKHDSTKLLYLLSKLFPKYRQFHFDLLFTLKIISQCRLTAENHNREAAASRLVGSFQWKILDAYAHVPHESRFAGELMSY